MKFKFEALNDLDLLSGSSYLCDFGKSSSQEETAILEGKLLCVFGEPAYVSENYENSFDYVIRATADDGRSVILSVYNVGMIHIGSSEQDPFVLEAANALIEYVTPASPKDYERTVYYLDFNIKATISVKDGKAIIDTEELSDEECDALFDKFYDF